METSLVSIIVPCYNYGHLLHETLDSLLQQTYKYWECIIVDDGSTDNTAQVSARYQEKDKRFRYIYQHNKGLAAARNTGLRNTKGKYIQLLDADDLLSQQKIQKQVIVLDEQPDVDLVYGKVLLFEKDLSAISIAKPFVMQLQKSGVGESILTALLEDNMFLVHCVLFRSSVVKEVGLFNENMITCEDWNFWFRCAFLGKRFLFCEDDESHVYVRSHGINMSSNRKNMWIGRIFFRKEAAKLLLERNVISSNIKILEKRNDYLLIQISTRFHLAYGNMLRGIYCTFRMIFTYNDSFDTIRDSLYWIKERFLNRV